MGQVGKIRVLVVDSHATVRKGLATFLETVDNLALVAEASNGPEAFHFCYLFRPDIVLMDLQTQGLDAVTVTHLIHECYGDTQVIVLAADNEDKTLIDAALKAGAIVSLQKTVSASELTRTIEVAFASRKQPINSTKSAANSEHHTINRS